MGTEFSDFFSLPQPSSDGVSASAIEDEEDEELSARDSLMV